MEILKCVVIGAPVSGKTSLINTFMSGSFIGYIPDDVVTRYDVNLIVRSDSIINDPSLENKSLVNFREKNYLFKVYDYDIDKPNSVQFLNENELNDIDLIILCYNSFTTLSQELMIKNYKNFIKSKWPNAPVVLVSCFSDLLKYNKANIDDQFLLEHTLPYDQELKAEFGSKKHFYCSSMEFFNINKVFIESFKTAIINKLNTETRSLIKARNYASQEVIFNTSSASSALTQVYLVNQDTKLGSNVFKTLTKFFISLFISGCVFIYFFSYQYCNRNKNHCAEIYELSLDVFDDSLSTLNESYINLIGHLNKFKSH